MCIAFNAPHDPRQSPQKYVDMYPADSLAVPDNFLPLYPYCEPMATSWDLARVEKPQRVEFNSILPILDGRSGSPYRAVYGAYLNRQRSVCTDRYKLILYPQAAKSRLYDLQADPHEMDDLADRPESLPLMKDLFAQFQKLQQPVKDPMDLSETFTHLRR